MNMLGNEISRQTDASVEWTCTTFRNPTTLHPHTAGLILEVEGDRDTVVSVELNGGILSAAIGELLEGNRTTHLRAYNSEAFMIHRAVEERLYTLRETWSDDAVESECDVYHVEIRQMNGQCAWLSPIYALA
ncbi:hypothetical protein [Paenibacillus sp. 1P03SA]|uniref:hypothetical protein n=1 Tax=Paenibacillus sp. 1P03SA TaxID=3132294 RepID=UPI00399F76CB